MTVMPGTLLDGAFYPITRELGFLDAPFETVVERYHAWQRWIVETGRQKPFVTSATMVHGSLRETLPGLLPLTSAQIFRVVFSPTVSGWTAYFDNLHRGSDPAPPVSYLAEQLHTRWVRAVIDLPDRTAGTTTNLGGDLLFEHHGKDAIFGPGFEHKRILDLTSDDRGRFSFRQLGDPLPFEDLDRYRARRVAHRFNLAIMEEYLAHLGIHALREGFYNAGGMAMLFERTGYRHPNSTDWTLEEAQALRWTSDWTAARVV